MAPLFLFLIVFVAWLFWLWRRGAASFQAVERLPLEEERHE
jgi:hypothetical protein